MVTPLILIGVSFVLSLLGQLIWTRHRLAATIFSALMPPAVLALTVWWKIWNEDALWIVAFAFALFYCAVGAALGAIAIWLARSLRRRFRPNDN